MNSLPPPPPTASMPPRPPAPAVVPASSEQGAAHRPASLIPPPPSDPAPGVSRIEALRPPTGTDGPIPPSASGAQLRPPSLEAEPEGFAAMPGLGADGDLQLQVLRERERRQWLTRYTSILGGFALSAYLAASGNGAIIEGVLEVAVGAALGAAGAYVYASRRGLLKAQ